VTYRDGVKQLGDQWAAGIIEISDETLRFAGDPELAVGSVFVVQDRAYKVVSLEPNGGETVLGLTAPTLNELFSSFLISGRAELGAANFTLDPAIAAASTSADTNKDNDGPNNGWVLQPSNYMFDGWKTAKITGTSRTIDEGATVRGSFAVGGRFETDADGWDPIFNRGGALLEVMMAPDLLLYLEQDANYPSSDEVCTTAGLGGGHGRIRIGTLSVPTNLPAVRVNLPFCASIVSEVSGSLEVLKLSGQVDTKVTLQGSSEPQVKVTDMLVPSVPGSDNARIPDGPYLITAQPSTLKKVAVAGTFALEQSLELAANGRIRIGVTSAATSKFDYSGSAAAAAVDRYFDSEARSPSPDVCIHAASDTYVTEAKVSWERQDIEVTSLGHSEPSERLQSMVHTYGTCACENGDESAGCGGGTIDVDVPVAPEMEIFTPADTPYEGLLFVSIAQTYQITVLPAHGTVTLDQSVGTFTYVPDAGYTGMDVFSYVARNAAGTSEPALVSVTVVPTGGPETQRIEGYKNRSSIVAAGSAARQFSAVTQPAHGKLVQSGSSIWMYSPEAEYVGDDSFSYSDGGPDPIMVQVTILPTCEMPAFSVPADERTTFSSLLDGTSGVYMRTFPTVEVKYDWDSNPDHCYYSVAAKGGADLWIKLPSKPEQSRIYQVTSSTLVGADQVFFAWSDYDSLAMGTVSVTRQGEEVIIQGTDLRMDAISGSPMTVSFTVVGR
jgi:hypothetical protein